MTTLIVGCGYLGQRVGRLLAARGEPVHGTVRSPARAEQVRACGIEPRIADVLVPETLSALPHCDRLLYCVGFDRTAGIPLRTVYVDGLRNLLDQRAGEVARFVYASSTGVYGRNDGGWVTEADPAEPVHESGRVCLEAEHVLRAAGGIPAIILRFAGLYGPGRLPRRASLERGEPLAGDPSKYLNLVHIDDAAAAAVAALERGEPGATYLVADDRPVPRSEFYERLAELLGCPPPRFERAEPGSARPEREDSNKRVSNRRMRNELGVRLAYPDITAGLAAALGEDRG
jgi:nucleoside-diphosphate-sugar epimerase